MTPETIRIGRLEKKVARLKTQRDYWKKQYDHYFKVIKSQPYIERRYKSYQDRIDTEERQKAITKRVKEQEILIRMLLKDDPLRHYEIDALYSKLIKEEYRKLNETV